MEFQLERNMPKSKTNKGRNKNVLFARKQQKELRKESGSVNLAAKNLLQEPIILNK